MEEQKYQIGDIVEVVLDDTADDVRIAKVVSIGICTNHSKKYAYGVSFNLNGTTADKHLLAPVPGDGLELSAWIDKKVSIS